MYTKSTIHYSVQCWVNNFQKVMILHYSLLQIFLFKLHFRYLNLFLSPYITFSFIK